MMPKQAKTARSCPGAVMCCEVTTAPSPNISVNCSRCDAATRRPSFCGRQALEA